MDSNQDNHSQSHHANQPQTNSGSSITAPSPALSQSSTVYDLTPRTPFRHRATFARLASVDDGKYQAIKDEDDITDASPYNDDRHTQGLGISMNAEPKTHDSHPDDTKDLHSVETHELPAWSPKYNAKHSVTSFQSSFQQSTAYSPDTQRLRDRRSVAESMRMIYDEFAPSDACAAHEHFHHGRKYWLSVTILTLAVYSTIFSGIFLILSLHGFRYKWIRQGGKLSIEEADLLAGFFAKTIELSFATVFVSFLGQVLSRRAFMKAHGRGITLAEMDMRSWIMQPGTMITHFEALKSSILSFLGALSLVAAIVGMLYTTASTALVQPQLRFSSWHHTAMQGRVLASFGNASYLAENCPTPILPNVDSVAGPTCMQIQYAAQGYHNYQRYISDWSTLAGYGNGSKKLSERPKGFALLNEDTTVTAPWVDIHEVEENFNNYGRIINNVTLVMPHAGVPVAARDHVNGILQPEDLNGQGIYSIRASVPSPAVNVLCVNMNEEELEPLIWEKWVEKRKVNATEWPTPLYWYGPGNYLNKTVVDDIFWWGEQYQMSPPVFPRLPADYNTILNHTGLYGRKSIYLLGKAPDSDYSLCAIKVLTTPNCSTEYTASSLGASIKANCDTGDDPHYDNDMQYIRSLSNATTGASNVNTDWVDIGHEWANSLSLNAGITDGAASNARLLTELILKTPTLNGALPSIAEALAVLAGCTLLISSAPAPFVQFWNYTSMALEEAQYQWFNATIRAQEYASGGSDDMSTRGFYVVLFAVFIINLMCLGYFISQNGLVTDFSEPLNLFSLAVNSPPSDLMAGSCAAGPRGDQFKVGWFVNAAGDHLFMENRVDRDDEGDLQPPQVVVDQENHTPRSPLSVAFEKLSHRKSWF